MGGEGETFSGVAGRAAHRVPAVRPVSPRDPPC